MPATYTKEFVANKLQTNNEWLFKGILAIYSRQTSTEQAVGMTREHNNVGFNAIDSVILSSFAEQIKTFNGTPVRSRRFRTPLSTRQIAIAQRKMNKYAGQLAAIANANTAAPAATAQAAVQDPSNLSEEEQYNLAHQ